MNSRKPQALAPGDIVRVVASSSPFERPAFEAGINILKDFGLKVKFRQDIFARNFHLAGSDKRRLTELCEAFLDPECRAIFFARGGYGSMRLLPSLAKKLHRKKISPKIILGYSDITALQIWVMQTFKWPVFYGPVVAKDLSQTVPPENLTDFWRCISNPLPLDLMTFPGLETLHSGKAQGVLTGGCLSILCSLLGTPFAPIFKNNILFIEDVNEKPYEVERLLIQLKLAGKLKSVNGILVGSLNGPGTHDDYQRVLKDVFSDFKGPVLTGFPAGHSERKVTLPLGVKVQLDAKKRQVVFLEGALDPKNS